MRSSVIIATIALSTSISVQAKSLIHDTNESYKQPNILLILTDNTGWGDWGPYGGGSFRGAPSPNVDKLAQEGLLLQNFNTEPQCTPSRSALLTGRLAIRSGNQSIPIGTPLYGLLPWEKTMAELLSEKGYSTGIFGKWHLGRTQGRWPTDQGFDEWFGIPNSTDDIFLSNTEKNHSILKQRSDLESYKQVVKPNNVSWVMEGTRNLKPEKKIAFDIEERKVIDKQVTEKTLRFIEKNAESNTPFFAYVPLTATHYPTLPSPEFEGASGNGSYADMLMQTDSYLGKMLDKLDELKIADDTIVIFASDNGAEHPDNGDGQYSGWTGPWRGTYFTAMEGGIRAPFIIRWPGKVPANEKSNEIVHITDIMPTLLSMTKTEQPSDRIIDGMDMSKFFTGQNQASGRDGFIIFVGDDLRAIKWKNWKIHFSWQETKYSPIEKYSTVPKVVDLIKDPQEKRQVAEPYNIWAQYAVSQLIGEYKESLKIEDNIPPGSTNSYRK